MRTHHEIMWIIFPSMFQERCEFLFVITGQYDFNFYAGRNGNVLQNQVENILINDLDVQIINIKYCKPTGRYKSNICIKKTAFDLLHLPCSTCFNRNCWHLEFFFWRDKIKRCLCKTIYNLNKIRITSAINQKPVYYKFVCVLFFGWKKKRSVDYWFCRA